MPAEGCALLQPRPSFRGSRCSTPTQTWLLTPNLLVIFHNRRHKTKTAGMCHSAPYCLQCRSQHVQHAAVPHAQPPPSHEGSRVSGAAAGLACSSNVSLSSRPRLSGSSSGCDRAGNICMAQNGPPCHVRRRRSSASCTQQAAVLYTITSSSSSSVAYYHEICS